MVTYMIVWMRRHARELKDLEGARRRALAEGSAWRWSRWRSSRCCARASRPRSSCWRRSKRATTPLAAGSAPCSASSSPSASATASTAAASGSTCPLLPGHRRGAGPGRRRPGGHRAPHRPRGRLARRRPGQAFDLSWLVAPRHRHSSLLTGVLGIQPYPDWTRSRLAGLRDPDARRRAVAGPRPARPRPRAARPTAP